MTTKKQRGYGLKGEIAEAMKECVERNRQFDAAAPARPPSSGPRCASGSTGGPDAERKGGWLLQSRGFGSGVAFVPTCAASPSHNHRTTLHGGPAPRSDG
jgi:hypothetical protein